MQITHQIDPETGHYVQVVTAAELRKILDDAGETYDRPDHMTDSDQWDVEEQ